MHAEPTLAEILTRATRADFSEREQVFLVPVPGDTFVRLSGRALAALQLHAAGMTLEDAATATRGNEAHLWDGARVAQIRDRLVERARAPHAVDDGPAMFLRRPLLGQPTVEWLARRLRVLFGPLVATTVIASTLVTFAATTHLPRTSSATELAVGYLWMIGSLIAHELGHASAATYFGCRPGPIGFTFYVIYPALYSDVTAAWTLRRHQRVVVDAGGVYFQLVFTALFMALGAIFGVRGTQVGSFMVAFSVVMTLHPFLAFDGYWMLSDALGVANLAKQRRRLCAALWARLRRRAPAPLPFPPLITAALAIYAIASVVFTLCFAVYLGPRMWRALLGYPARVRAAIDDIAAHGYPQSLGPWLALA
ncbi:MAG: hypothetical protein ABI678_21265, partial [Kofleriaceae bacterium]